VFGKNYWVAAFIDITNNSIYYFDSSGDDKIPRKISKFITMVKKQGNKLKINFNVVKNKIIHQRKESECGIYCLYFIINLINFKKNNTLPEIFLKRIKDDEINKFRYIYFNIY
jgi:Ulp1 family protease